MTDAIKRSDLKYPNAAGDRALEPVIQSAMGIVRESAGLLHHIAGIWHRAGVGPEAKSRRQADTLVRTKGRECNPFPATRNVKPPAKTQQE
jgi:hypothetical protein